MNQRQATFRAIILSILTALFGAVMVVLTWLLYGMFPLGNLEQTYVAILRLDGVMFGFVLAAYSFLFEKIKVEPSEREWGYVILISIFISLLGSILFAFLGLLSVNRLPHFSIISICLTIGVIVNVLFWIQDLTFPHKRTT